MANFERIWHGLSAEAQSLVLQIADFDQKHPNALEPEMLDFLKVVEFGRNKHPDPQNGARANWLLPEGSTASHKDMHDRIFHHIARSFADPYGVDEEFPVDHLLFAICRSVMMYIRRKRKIAHPSDPAKEIQLQEVGDMAEFQENYNRGPNL